MEKITNDQQFLLGELRVEPARNCLWLGERQLSVQPKVMEVLQYLAAHQERVVSSEELMNQLWKGRIVTQGSVQKSINSLRKALSELLGDEEIVAHYSKRGYQLLLVPQWLAPDPLAAEAANVPAKTRPGNGRRWLLVAALAMALVALAVLFWVAPESEAPLHPPKAHATRFDSLAQIVSSPAHERDAEPHPGGRYLAYVRDYLQVSDAWSLESQLMIRNSRNEDWQIASSQGSWVALAWSPSGKQLVAIELWRHEALPPTPGFYESANFLYTFHVFSLDLDNNRLVEKYLLSQWMGQIQSVSWWNEETLEFVATQGPGTSQERYRYVFAEQALSSVDSPKGLGRPLFSALREGRTALASQQGQRVRVDLLDEQSVSRASWQFEQTPVDISWIPDGSGVLLFTEARQQLFALYWDGQQKEIALQQGRERRLSRPRYRPDGQALYLTDERPRSGLEWLALEGGIQPLRDDAEQVFSAALNADGQLAQLLQRGGQWQLQLSGVEVPKTLISELLTQLPGAIIWSDDQQQLVYTLGRRLFFFDLTSGKARALRLEAEDLEPLAYDPAGERLWVVKQRGEARHIWQINPQSLRQKQLTFGAVGAALVHNGSVYFQYRGKPGLWQLLEGQAQPQLLVENLEENMRLLAADEGGVYFVAGGQCRESAISRLDLTTGEHQPFMARDRQRLNSLSFHPLAGVVQQVCELPDANILMLE